MSHVSSPRQQYVGSPHQSPQQPQNGGMNRSLSPEDAAFVGEFEAMAAGMYDNNVPNDIRTRSIQQFTQFSQQYESIDHCRLVLNNSQSPFALVAASSTIKELIPRYWNKFSADDTIEIRNYLLNYLHSNYMQVQSTISTNMILLVCSITKKGWLADQRHRSVCDEITELLRISASHCILALELLCQLIEQVNTPLMKETLAHHRKVAVSFRDTALFFIFQLALTNLNQVLTNQIQMPGDGLMTMTKFGLRLAKQCLSFDYIGTNVDESVEDLGTIQVPASWRTILQDHKSIDLFFALFKFLPPVQVSESLEVLCLLSSVRRSVFATEDDRRTYFSNLISGTCDILQNHKGRLVEAPNAYHHFCRLLHRIKVCVCVCACIVCVVCVCSVCFLQLLWVALIVHFHPHHPPLSLTPHTHSLYFLHSDQLSTKGTGRV